MMHHITLSFSLYINLLVEKLRGAGLGVNCTGRMGIALLYVDDAVLLAEDEEQVKQSLRVIHKLCSEWAVDVNVEKSGVVHIRRRDVKTGGIFL